MRTLNDILDRLYQSLNIKNDAEFCRKYGIKKNTLSTWKARNKIPYELIEKISDENNLSLDWILKGKSSQNETGEGEMYKGNEEKDPFCAEICDNFKKLPKERQKYLYHKFMTELFENLQNI